MRRMEAAAEAAHQMGRPTAGSLPRRSRGERVSSVIAVRLRIRLIWARLFIVCARLPTGAAGFFSSPVELQARPARFISRCSRWPASRARLEVSGFARRTLRLGIVGLRAGRIPSRSALQPLCTEVKVLRFAQSAWVFAGEITSNGAQDVRQAF
jgi:hypothetical protein